jgi:hypothetical protein
MHPCDILALDLTLDTPIPPPSSSSSQSLSSRLLQSPSLQLSQLWSSSGHRVVIEEESPVVKAKEEYPLVDVAVAVVVAVVIAEEAYPVVEAKEELGLHPAKPIVPVPNCRSLHNRHNRHNRRNRCGHRNRCDRRNPCHRCRPWRFLQHDLNHRHSIRSRSRCPIPEFAIR